ncbi:MAG: hypothetical protein Q8O46_03155, partial [bacterium]|nr:hypothetical protein [bacterium]
FESRLIEANKGSVQTGGNKENISAIHHAMSTGAGSTQSAGDYLSDVADYLEKNRSGNRETNMQVRKLADELKTVRGEIETEWRTEGATPNGYDPKKALTKIRGLFGRLRQVNL